MNIPEELRSQVGKYVAKSKQMIQDHRDAMSERETETRLIEPMLEMLRWDPKGIDVRKAYSIKTEGSNYEADYALMINARPRMLIEVKKVANDLRDENVIQLMKYAFYEKADVFILTNGDEWRVYDPYDLRDMVFRFNLENMETSLDCLWLLSKESIETGLLDQEIDGRYAIEKIYEYIDENKKKWISDIAGISKKFTRRGISSILDRMIVGKREILRELSSEGERVSTGEEEPSTIDTQGTELDKRTIEGKSVREYASLGPIFDVMAPIFDIIESKVREFGEDVRVNVKKDHISFMRDHKHAFAIMYVRGDRIDIGLSLAPSVEDDRLRDASNWGWSRINKGTSVSKAGDVDEQLIGWLKQSYIGRRHRQPD